MHGVVVTQPGMERESTASSRFTLFFVFLFIDVVGVVFTLLGDEIGGEEVEMYDGVVGSTTSSSWRLATPSSIVPANVVLR